MTEAAKAAGMTDAEHAELLQVISLAACTKHLLTRMRVPVDAELEA